MAPKNTYHCLTDIAKKSIISCTYEKRLAIMHLEYFIYLSIHPLFWCLIAYCIGILIAHYCSAIFIKLIILLLIIATLTAYFSRKQSSLISLAIIGSFLLGSWRLASLQAHYTKVQDRLTQGPFIGEGVITDMELNMARTFKTSLIVSLESMNRQGKKYPIKATVQIQSIKMSPFLVGDHIKIYNLRIKRPKNDSFLHYLWKEGKDATIFLPFMRATLIKRPVFCLARYAYATRERIANCFAKKLSPASCTLAFALFLGKKPQGRLYNEFKKRYSFWGIVHYLARSGLHVMLIICTWYIILQYIPVHFFIKQCILLLLIYFYHALTWPSVSFLRALFTCIMYKTSVMLNVSLKSMHVLTVIMYLMLFYNPLWLFYLDFQLSFALALALAWFTELNFKIQRFYNIIENK